MGLCSYSEEYYKGTLSEDILIEMKKGSALDYLDKDLTLLKKIFPEYLKNNNKDQN